MPPKGASAAGIDRVLSNRENSSQAISHASGVGEHSPTVAPIARLHALFMKQTDDDYFSESDQRRDGRCGSCVTGERFMLALAGRAFGQILFRL